MKTMIRAAARRLMEAVMGRERLSETVHQIEQAQARRGVIADERKALESSQLETDDDAGLDALVDRLAALDAEDRSLAGTIDKLIIRARLVGNATLPARRAERAASVAEAQRECEAREQHVRDLEASREALLRQVAVAESDLVIARRAIDEAALQRHAFVAKTSKRHNVEDARAVSPLRPPAGVLVRFSDWFDLISDARSASAVRLALLVNEQAGSLGIVDARNADGAVLQALIERWPART